MPRPLGLELAEWSKQQERRRARSLALAREKAARYDPVRSIWRRVPVMEFELEGPACYRWAFFDLCRLATPAERDYTYRLRGKPVTVRLLRGQLVASLRYLAARWRWTKTKTEWFMAKLSAEGVISRIENPEYLVRPPAVKNFALPGVYAIVNYDRLDEMGRAGVYHRARATCAEKIMRSLKRGLVQSRPAQRQAERRARACLWKEL